MKYQNIREEELKNKVGADFFKDFDTTEIIGNIDFSVFPSEENLFGRTPLLWAEAKTGNYDLATMFVQLILTIGKARSFDKTLPPAFLGAFDFQKIAFVPYIAVQDIFYQNDFNWNVTPSNHQTKEFLLIKERIEASLNQEKFVFDYEKDEKELRFFIKNNITGTKTSAKIKIDKNNVLPIYLRWLEAVKPLISVDWDNLKKVGILDCDFYIADLFVDDKNTANISDDTSIQDGLFVVFKNEGYRISKENLKQMFDASISIKDKEAYQLFWKIYKRPPLKEYHDFIIENRHLFVPQDVRERKGAFFTPRQWVELSQKYLADVFGENWQDEYYIWDCAAGTGNLLAGLTNKYNIYASTLDQADVNVMHERIEHGANLLQKGNHIIGTLHSNGNDFQHQVGVFIDNDNNKTFGGLHLDINENNLISCSILFSSRHCIEANWLNDRDQFLYPNDGWQSDTDFQNDCLAFTLFHGQNRISSQNSPFEGGKGDVSTKNTLHIPSEGGMSVTPAEALRNHWLPFTESEVDAPERFESHFMTNFISGKLGAETKKSKENAQNQGVLPLGEEYLSTKNISTLPTEPLQFSEEATAVFDAGRELWKYYFARSTDKQFNNGKVGVSTPSLYDIREYFQGRNEKGKMNNKSEDEHYMMLIGELRDRLRLLAEKIQPKVYEYGFLRS